MPDDDHELAWAKINLFLHVTGRRPNGYHELDSLAVFAGIADRITYEPADGLSLFVTGPFAEGLDAGHDNLVLRAADALARDIRVEPRGRLTLEKNIPVASGVGGGSADAAAALRLLCRTWNVHPDAATLDRIAAGLGADVPVCLRARPCRMRGIGELLSPGPALPALGLLLVNPRVPVATPQVFKAREGAFSREAVLPGSWPNAAAMAADLRALRNDLQAPAIGIAPVIDDVLRDITESPDCLLARMSGSGATCFGLFATVDDAVRAQERMARTDWWYWAGSLLN